MSLATELRDHPAASARLATDGSDPLRILMVTARYFPSMGGTETHCYEVARRMAAAGHAVTILTANPGGRLPTDEQQEGIHIRRVRAYPADKDYFFAPGLYRAITGESWDIVHIQGYHTLVAPLAMASAWRAGLPYVVTFHSGGHSSRVRSAGRGLQRLLLRPLLAHARQLIGVSQFEADFFSHTLKIARERFTVVQNGARLPEVPESVQAEHTDTLIVSPGRLERYKGHQRVIAAMPDLLKARPDTRLRIVGGGPYEPELHQLAEQLGVAERVEIGSIPIRDRHGMAVLLSKADLVVLFSEYEAHPVSVMEALSLRRQVLVSDTSGLHELAEKGWVRAIPLDSTPRATADAMLNSLNQPLPTVEIVLPTWEGCTEQLLNIYRAVRERTTP